MPNSLLRRIKRTASELNQSAQRPPASGLKVFNAESIHKLDTLAWEILNSTGSGRISIELAGGPGKGQWRFDEIALRLDSEAARQA